MKQAKLTDAIPEGKPRLLRVPAARRELSIGNTMFYELINSGKIRSVKIGRARLIPADALTEFVASLSGASAQ